VKKEAKLHTSSNLFTELCLIYSTMFPPVIHSDTVVNGPSSMSPRAPISLETLG
jgi:hypothetical protein